MFNNIIYGFIGHSYFKTKIQYPRCFYINCLNILKLKYIYRKFDRLCV